MKSRIVTEDVRATALVVDPHSIWTLDQLREALGFSATGLKREVRAGRLRVSRRGGRYWTLGSWILAWIEAGDRTKGKKRAPIANGTGAHRPPAKG